MIYHSFDEDYDAECLDELLDIEGDNIESEVKIYGL